MIVVDDSVKPVVNLITWRDVWGASMYLLIQETRKLEELSVPFLHEESWKIYLDTAMNFLSLVE